MLSFQLLSHLLRQAFTCTHTHTHTLLTACHVRGHTFSLPHSDSLLVSHSHINTHTESSNRCSVSSSGRCSHPHGLSQHRQCFVSHKGSYHPGSGALLGPQQPPPDPRKAPGAATPQPAEVPRGTSVWLGWRDLAEVLTLRARELLIFQCVRVSVSVCVFASAFMWAQVPGSWEYPSTDNKWCERKDRVCCQTRPVPVNEPRVPAAGLPTIDSLMGSH